MPAKKKTDDTSEAPSENTKYAAAETVNADSVTYYIDEPTKQQLESKK
jgi:hypothetical protein